MVVGHQTHSGPRPSNAYECGQNVAQRHLPEGEKVDHNFRPYNSPVFPIWALHRQPYTNEKLICALTLNDFLPLFMT